MQKNSSETEIKTKKTKIKNKKVRCFVVADVLQAVAFTYLLFYVPPQDIWLQLRKCTSQSDGNSSLFEGN